MTYMKYYRSRSILVREMNRCLERPLPEFPVLVIPLCTGLRELKKNQTVLGKGGGGLNWQIRIGV